VVDDDIDMRELIALTLRHRGFDVVAVGDGTAAMATIVSDGVDALVTDLQMPGYDGVTLCRSLRALRISPALPIVVFTGVGRNDARLDALRDLSDIRVLHKPMGLGQIAPTLIEMIPTAALDSTSLRTLAHLSGMRASPT
jgi:DNA-binding response OmpR family regulator